MSIHHDLLAILDAVEIRSPTAFSVLGEACEVPAGEPEGPDESPLPAALAPRLYERVYCRPSPHPVSKPDALAGRDLLSGLSSANEGRGRWEWGWTIERIAEGRRAIVLRDGVRFSVRLADVAVADGPIEPGRRCRVRVGKELRRLHPGFYVAFGLGDGHPPREGPGEHLDRYYWHLMPHAAVLFMATVTSLLNSRKIPFELKVPRHPHAYRRADAGVLYTRRDDRPRVGEALGPIHQAVASRLRPEVPRFTKRLAEGLGFAENPEPSESFGQHRCRLIAEALWGAFVRGEADEPARIAALASAFRREGLDPLRPYLGPGPDAGDGPEPLSATRAASGSIETHRLGDRSDGTGPAVVASTDPFGAAIRIGSAICRSAHWDAAGRLCNWMGRSAREAAGPDGVVAPIAEALGHELYSGSAGIALFLAELYVLTGDEQHRRTARGAIARSIRWSANRTDEDAPTRLSFFVGALGLAYVAWRVSVLIKDPEIRSEVDPIIACLGPVLSVPHGLDVIGGNAGAIPALLAMSRSPGLESCRELAILLGDELCRLDLSRPGSPIVGIHHESGSGREEPIPSGFSHGAAGIGLALLELHHETGESAFRDAARRAFEYEDRLFDPDRRNWADLRRASGSSTYELAWCNGAPGIALARLRAAALDPDRKDHYLDMARIAIATTFGAIETNLAIPRYDATPCHGLAGLIEIAWTAGWMFDDASYRERALTAAQVLIDRYCESGDWPSGLYSGGPNPSLMLGTAGVGYTFLRLHDPERVPSVLWIGC
jgi:hypothetical protein